MTAANSQARDERGQLLVPESEDWKNWTSVEDFLKHCPDRYETLSDALDLDHPGLEKVKAAVNAGDKTAACKALLAYYRTDGRCEWLLERLDEPGSGHVKLADQILHRKHQMGKAVGVVPEKNGAWDWNYTGPKGDREYAFNLNRHPFFPHLLQAYRKTGDEKYVQAFDRIVRDWVLHTVYPSEKHAYVWTWRVLEAGLRMRSWTIAFHGFQKSDSFTPAGRLLMLSSFVQHGRYIKMHHWNHHNHALMEHDGLNRIGLALPELKEAEGWHEYALKKMLEEMNHQVYPDGAHDELSSGYHWVSLKSYEQIDEICRTAGREVPEDYRKRLVDMYDYWAGLVRPDLSLPQNNRSDRSNARGRLLNAAEKYGRSDWRYIVTNGQDGEKPEGLPSRMAPWAGHLVSRDDWSEDALWSFFDAGPAGAGWVHPDALHLSVSAYGKDFLIDSGRFWYMRDQWTNFAHSSRSHNVILIDGRNQEPQPKKVEKPLSEKHWALTETFDYARATHDRFDKLEGKAAHTRIVVFLRTISWVVIDRIATDRKRELTPMWRFCPERKVEVAGKTAVQTNDAEGANLCITPLGGIDWSVKLVRGQEKPYLQGWYSEETTEWEPNTCAVYAGTIEGDAVFGWLILPVKQGQAAPATEATLTVQDGNAAVRFIPANGGTVALTIPLDEGKPTLVSIPDNMTGDNGRKAEK
jgi:hypothetical protein